MLCFMHSLHCINFSHSNQSEREKTNNDIDHPKVDMVPLVSGDYAPPYGVNLGLSLSDET